MFKKIKANNLYIFVLLFFAFFLILQPKLCISSCLNAISIWTYKLFPVMFPFFILTKSIVSLWTTSQNKLDKYFSKIYNAPNGSLFIFFLSALSGYPMGAKLISNLYENKKISNNQAKSMLSFCSISGPMFIIGTVGVSIFNSYKIGVIILISNIIASLLNGLIFRDKSKSNQTIIAETKDTSIFDIMYDSILSILIISGFLVVSYLLISIFDYLNIFKILSNVINYISFNKLDINIIKSVLIGSIEMTTGVLALSNVSLSPILVCTIASGIISFGGLSIILQSKVFLDKANIKIFTILKQKFIQSILSMFIAFLISIIIF